MKDVNTILKEEYIKYGAKHISIRAKKLGLKDEIINHTSNLPEYSTLAQRIYHIINDIPQVPQVELCDCGNFKKFESITKGYRPTCGKGCSSIKQIQRKKSKEYQNSLIKEKRDEINQKRKNTRLARYGNEYQTPKQKERHEKFYSKKENIENQNKKQRETMQRKYGVSHIMHLPETKKKIQSTMQERHGVNNALQLEHTREKLSEVTKTFEYKQKIRESQLEAGFKKFQERLQNSGYELLDDEYKGTTSQVYRFQHNCGHEFEKLVNSTAAVPICRKCYPINSFKSNQEQEIFEFVKDYFDDAIQSNRNLIKPQELDIYIPSKNIAIEFCGLLWHSESFGGKDKWYHFNKWEKCKDKGIRLITIWDSEWINKQEIVKNRLKYILNINENETVGARECSIKEIDTAIAKNFCEKYHLHGYNNSSVKLGAFYEDELVGVMTFGKRKITGGISEWEIMRFCTSCNVVGLASRFVGKFKKDYHPEKLISYSDNRWDTGKVYENIGFVQTNKSEPNYWYSSNYHGLEHRYKFRKKRLIEQGADSSLTEKEIMVSLGYDRVWDCGVRRWELDLSKKEWI